jgi:two-component system, sensor histidine kinase YesM
MRYQDKLNYSFHIYDEIWDDKMPKLAIQPLVENALKYAFQNMKQGGHIAIRGYRSGSSELIFEVEDNGVGMPEERVRALLAACEQEDSVEPTGLGIQLVHQRAKYLYGEGYGVSIRSAVGTGTIIMVKLGSRTAVKPQKAISYTK